MHPTRITKIHQDKYQNSFFFRAREDQEKPPSILENEIVKKIAKKHSRSPAQIILRFFLQNNIIMIPKSINPDRIKENFDLMSFSLDEIDVGVLRNLN